MKNNYRLQVTQPRCDNCKWCFAILDPECEKYYFICQHNAKIDPHAQIFSEEEWDLYEAEIDARLVSGHGICDDYE